MSKINEMEYGWKGGDQTGSVGFSYKVEPEIETAILKSLSSFCDISTSTLKILRPTDKISGSYKLYTRSGSFFVRVSNRIGNYDLESSIAEHLLKQGVLVNKYLLGGLELKHDGELFRVDVRELISGHHFKNNEQELALVSCEIGNLHKKLKEFPLYEEVIQNQSEISKRHHKIQKLILNQNFECFHERKDWAKRNKEWLIEVANFYDPFFALDPSAQCVHGQPHPGNVLFQEGKAILFDLETSVFTYARKEWDLGYLVQRFCMADDPETKILRKRLEIIQENYGLVINDLTDAMRTVSVYSIFCAIDYRNSNICLVPESEFDKFMNLEAQAQRYREILG